MKIYTSASSPFGSRVTIATRVKGLAMDWLPLPEGGLRSPEYRAINPVGKIPVLITESGARIPESMAILDYIEDRFPTPSLRPGDPEKRARMNIAIRIMDTYVMAPVIQTFPHLDPSKRDERFVELQLARWNHGLAVLAQHMAAPLPEAEAGLSLADCVLPPSLHLNKRIARMLGVREDPMTAHATLVDYYSRMSAHPIVGPVLTDLTTSQAKMDANAAKNH